MSFLSNLKKGRKMADKFVIPDVKKVNVFWAVVAGFFEAVLFVALFNLTTLGAVVLVIIHSALTSIFSEPSVFFPFTIPVQLSQLIWLAMFLPILILGIKFEFQGKSLIKQSFMFLVACWNSFKDWME